MGAVQGFSPAETLGLLPGTIFDLWTLYLRAHGVQPEPDTEKDYA